MRAATFLFATDLHDEGIETVLDNVQHRGGMQGLTLACSYHHARDVFPHNPVRKIRFLEGGAVFFRPDPDRYRDLRIQPHVSQLAQETDMLAVLMEHAERRGLAVRAWTVYLHNTTLGSRYPDCAVHNAFDDPYITSLCPANPEVRNYVAALTADIARYGVEAILAEALSYQPFDHGYHHERSFIPLSPIVRFLLGLCFCRHCLEAVGRQGVDGERVRQFVRDEVERVFDTDTDSPGPGAPTLETLESMASGELGRFLKARESVVTSLATEATQATRRQPDTRFTFMEMSGAALGYATGQPSGAPAPGYAWKDGVDVRAIGQTCSSLSAIGYARDPERIREDLEAYRSLIPEDASLSVALRPMWPDCESVDNLAAKAAIARDLGIDWIDFYHYGFMRLSSLDLIRAGLSG